MNNTRRSTTYTVSEFEKRKNQAEQLTKRFTKVLNTAVVSTRVETPRNLSQELKEVMQSPAFRAILKATRDLSQHQAISENDAAEQIIRTFRRLDELWGEYLVREGVDRIKGR